MSEAPQLVIRPLCRPDETPLCARLLVTSEPWLGQYRTYEDGLRLLRDPAKEVYVAVVAAEVVGLIILHTGAPFSGYLQAVSVRPEWRNRGIGRKLITFAEQRLFRESPSVCLCVSSANTAAQRLYTRLGYEPVGALAEPLPGSPSEILMRKTIPAPGWREGRNPRSEGLRGPKSKSGFPSPRPSPHRMGSFRTRSRRAESTYDS